jgi:hypothetical protein
MHITSELSHTVNQKNSSKNKMSYEKRCFTSGKLLTQLNFIKYISFKIIL